MAFAVQGLQRSLETLFRGEDHNLEVDRGRQGNIVRKEADFEDQFNREKDKDHRGLNNSEIDQKRVEKLQVEEEYEYIEEQKGGIEDIDSVRLYSRDSYAREMFQTLKHLKDLSLLTDLTLTTKDGQHLHAHSPVLAAVSSLVHQRLPKWDEEMDRKDVVMISLSLGPEVGSKGLAALLEFAYTGTIATLNRDSLDQVKVAARTLGVARVLELCYEEEEKMKRLETRAEERKVSAEEQMKLSLQSIRQLWKERLGCDVELHVGKTSFLVHRVLLAASSDYFRAMFTCGMKESQQPCVDLPFLEASEMEALISCTYSGSIQLNWGCVFEITCTALRLQFQHILSMCLSFLVKEMDAHRCLDVASFAEAYGMQELLETANEFVLGHFQNVAATPKFQDLPANKLRKYLKSNSLLVTSELVVFKAVAVWIEARPSKRLGLTKELMKSVQFPLMTYNEFKEVKTAKLWTQFNTRCLYQAILDDFCSCQIAPRSLCRVYQPKDNLVLVGGDQISADLSRQNPSRELWFGNTLRSYTGLVKNVEWKLLTEMPNTPRLSHDVAVLAEKLYVVGGQDYSGRLNVLKSAYRYDPIQNSWERLADLQEKRCNFSIVLLEGMLYAIGGDSDPETNLNSVEVYCPDTDTWSFVRPLDMTLSCHAATMLDEKIFISGGYQQRYQCLTSLFMYHPERGTVYLSDMSQPRAYHCMETLHGHLYVAGGITLDENMTSIDQLICEVYNPISDTWNTFTNLPFPHVGAASVVLEEKLYVLGGYFKNNYRETRLVHRYDPTLQYWEYMGVMPGPNTDIRACLIRLPNHLRKCPNI